LRGTIELDGDRLHVQTNAEPRLERIKAVIEEVVDGADLLDEVRRPAADLFPAGGRGASAGDGIRGRRGRWRPRGSLGPPARAGVVTPVAGRAPGGAACALEAEIRRHEEAWVDESIPMFGGLTPRQALEDPTRRGQLLAFLDEVEATAMPGGMDAGRIRRLLGLTP
jgi:hypothetical protein